MIPQASITAWRSQAPWPTDVQVEQDLVLSRMMIEIANDAVLGPELAMRGGTCLHKLHLDRPARYSEDLDYVRRTRSGIGPVLDSLTAIAERIGLRRIGSETTREIANVKFEAAAADGGRFRIKVEINIAEVDSFRPRIGVGHTVESPWWEGVGEITTFAVEELLGTKFRALYQRKKGRDLFDLWLALTSLELVDEEIVGAFFHYIGNEEFTFPQLARNLEAKLESREYGDDLLALIAVPPAEYDAAAAADLVIERLGAKLRNAPALDRLENGAWRL